VLDVTGTLDAAERSTLTSLLATEFARFDGLDVVARGDVARLLELEGERQAAGCDDGACLAELVGALDVDLAAVAQAGRVGGTTLFTLQLVDRKGSTVAQGSAEVSDLDDLLGRVRAVVATVGTQVTGEEPDDAGAAAVPAGSSSSSPLGLVAGWRLPLLVGGAVTFGLGAVVAGVGFVPLQLYGSARNDLRDLRVEYVGSGGDDAVLDQAAARQRDAEGLRQMWNQGGVPAVWIGSTVAVVGATALVLGLLVEDGEPR
jgi:hypothetical protein